MSSNRRTIVPPMELSTKPLPSGTLATKTGYDTSFSLRRRFSKERTLSCRLRIAPAATSSIFLGSIGLPATRPADVGLLSLSLFFNTFNALFRVVSQGLLLVGPALLLSVACGRNVNHLEIWLH